MIRKSLLALLLASALSGTAAAIAPTALAGTKIVPLSAGAFHTCALTPAGGVQCWGAGGDGTGSTVDQKVPIDVPGLTSGATGIFAGWYHTCARTTGAEVRCWGDNTRGQLGDGTTTSRNEPVPVTGLANDVETVSAGGFHTCAIVVGGIVQCWGDNGYGQLGDGTTTSRLGAVVVQGVNDAVEIAAGYHHTCAVLADHSVMCWGENFDGEVGDGTTVDRSTPTLVPGLSATSVVLGESHTCALRTDGGVSCWGDNGYGNLGTGDFDDSLTPVPVPALAAAVTQISSHGIGNCALTNSGEVYCWGDNIRGQVGDGTDNNVRQNPTLVTGLSNVAEIAAGYYHSCALTTSGVAKCWGYNRYGELGNGTTTNSNIPVDVLGSFGPSHETPPEISIADVTVVEGDSGSYVPVAMTITLSEPSPSRVTVAFATSDGTAQAGFGNDYLLQTGLVAIDPGATTATFNVTVGGDTWFEEDETFFVTLSNATIATIADGSATVTIENDDVVAPVSISIGDASTAEGNVGTTPVSLTVSLSEASTATVSVRYATAESSAMAGVDFQSASGTLTFAPGETSKILGVNVLGDTLDENEETFAVTLSQPTKATLADDTGIVTIFDDESSLTIRDSSVTEGNEGTASASFVVTLSGPQRSTITVDYTTVPQDASAGSDFVARTGTLTFVPLDVEETISIDVNGDTTIEADETFSVTLSNPVGTSIDDGIGQGTIVNDDLPSISIGDATAREGNTGSSPAALTISLSAATPATVTVQVATAESSATSGADFQAISEAVTFAPGETTKQFSVIVLGDNLDEPDETFAVRLSGPTNATLADAVGIVTITDDDAPPTLSVNDVSLREGDTGSAPLNFTISLSAPSGKAITVSANTSNGTASSGSDYIATTAVVTIAVGATSGQLTVPIRGDTADENSETFYVRLSSPSNATIVDGLGIGTIVDDDPKPVITDLQPALLPQGDQVAIRGSGFTGATSVTFANRIGLPIPAVIFQVVNDMRVTAIVPPGATSGRVSVTTPNGTGVSPFDMLIEPTITSFSPPAGQLGTVVTIRGTGLFSVTAIRFGSTAAPLIPVTDTMILTVVPPDAKSSKIVLFYPGGAVSTTTAFTVIPLVP